ncbi:hypothetical protein L1987_67140 [Smallanthus sonchifolius]|uniref:Uncharacterized protein n=1 Tax=Smallanthus sonchifolius TaxID=185202 RepID=A0ACB9BZ96_9ASTR|nr:hypothetical protein L1987_67140 [Smallanthus sonchifolius]
MLMSFYLYMDLIFSDFVLLLFLFLFVGSAFPSFKRTLGGQNFGGNQLLAVVSGCENDKEAALLRIGYECLSSRPICCIFNARFYAATLRKKL